MTILLLSVHNYNNAMHALITPSLCINTYAIEEEWVDGKKGLGTRLRTIINMYNIIAQYIFIYHCKNVRVISTLSGLAQLHLFRGLCNSLPNECFHIFPWAT